MSRCRRSLESGFRLGVFLLNPWAYLTTTRSRPTPDFPNSPKSPCVYPHMKILIFPAFLALAAVPAALEAQDLRDSGPTSLASELPAPAASLREAGVNVLQEELTTDLHFGLSIYARVDVPGDTSVDSQDSIAYSDIFDVGFGVNAEASLMSRLTPHWSLGGYLSVGWDRFTGSSSVDMGTGEFFSFDDQDMISVIVGVKTLHKFAPFWFWEGRMGVGLIHYGNLTFTDMTDPTAPVSGLQFFRAVNHGLFDLGGRVGFGSGRVTLDLGLDFRFQGAEARGRDVSDVVDPDWFFVFAIDLGV